jgi:hypothetical protein
VTHTHLTHVTHFLILDWGAEEETLTRLYEANFYCFVESS